MFDIGFTELLVVAVVGLLVIGPERLPGAIRTGGAWVRRIRRGYSEIRQEVERELHNDAVMRALQDTRQDVERELHNDPVMQGLQDARREVEKNNAELEQELRGKRDGAAPGAGPGRETGNGAP